MSEHDSTARNCPTPGADSDQGFPSFVLPNELSEYVLKLVGRTGFEYDYIAVVSLLGLASITGKRICLQIDAQWQEYPSFFCCLVGPSGCGKSHPLERAFIQAFVLDLERNKAYAEECKHFRSRLNGVPVEKDPVPNDLTVADATMESILDTLSKNPSGLVSIRDELAGFFEDLT